MKITKSLKIALRSLLMKCGELATDKAKLIYDAEELVEGLEVYVEVADEEGNVDYQPAEDGDYETETQIITIVEGKVSAIKEKEQPKEEEEKPVEEQMEDIVEPAAEPQEPIEEEPDVTATTEERVAALEERITEIVEGLQKILDSMSAFETRLAEVEAKVAKVEETPAAEPIVEEPIEEEHKSKLSYLRK